MSKNISFLDCLNYSEIYRPGFLSGGVLDVGRGKDNDIVVPLVEKKGIIRINYVFSRLGSIIEGYDVDEKHCQVHREGDEYYVEDLCSRKGTYVNGRRVFDYERLVDGDRLVLGSRELKVMVNESIIQKIFGGVIWKKAG